MLEVKDLSGPGHVKIALPDAVLCKIPLHNSALKRMLRDAGPEQRITIRDDVGRDHDALLSIMEYLATSHVPYFDGNNPQS